MARFLSSASVEAVDDVFPGWNIAPAGSLFPHLVTVEDDFSVFHVRAGDGEPTALCFSKAIFVGFVDGGDTLEDVSSRAECEQSSMGALGKAAGAGVSGGQYGLNVQTGEEVAPWWRASFPDNVKVRQIYLYRQCGWDVPEDDHLRVTGVRPDGEEVVLHYHGDRGQMGRLVAEKISQGTRALENLLDVLTGEARQEYDALVSKGMATLLEDVKGRVPPVKGGIWNKVLRLFGVGHAAGLAEPAGDDGRMLRASAVDHILKALDLALGGAKDFGCMPETGLEINVPAFEAQTLRFRTFGELPPGLAGCELYAPGEDAPFETVGAKRLKFQYMLPGFHSPESYRIGIRAQLRSRQLRLGESRRIDRLKVWNLNRQHAANTLFLEVAARNNEGEPWRVIYDHGAPYRFVCQALALVDCLVGHETTPAYAHLLGKMFTQYRRKHFMSGVAKLFRAHAELNKAVFKGSSQIAPQTKFAAPLRLGKHGLGVPIAFRDQDVVMKHLVEMRDKIREGGHKPLFMYGTLLGAIREKDFIPHDDDVDLAIIMEGVGPQDLDAECDRFVEYLNEIGVKAKRGSAVCPLIHCHRGPITYDIFLIGHVGDKIYWPHRGLALKEEPADIFLPTGTIEFKGEVFDAPRDPEAVSEARYGKDWHIPNPAFEW